MSQGFRGLAWNCEGETEPAKEAESRGLRLRGRPEPGAEGRGPAGVGGEEAPLPGRQRWLLSSSGMGEH